MSELQNGLRFFLYKFWKNQRNMVHKIIVPVLGTNFLQLDETFALNLVIIIFDHRE